MAAVAAFDPLAAVRRAFDAVGRGDVAPLVDLLAADVAYTLIGSTALSGTHRGRDAVLRDLFAPLGAALAAPLRFTIRRLLRDGDCVVMQADGETALRSGALYGNTYAMVLRFAGAQVVELTEYCDTALISRAFAVPAERSALLRAMDLNCWEMYREIARLAPGSELFETPRYHLAYAPRGGQFHNACMVTAPIGAGELLRDVEAFYAPRRAPFSIWLRAHADADLEAALLQRGLALFLTMPGMALLGDPGTQVACTELTIRAALDDRGRDDYRHVSAEAYATYGAPREYAAAAFAKLESVCAPHLQGFVGYADGAPVAAAAVYVTHGVAGIGWVGCVPEARGKRYAEAVTWAAVREGFRRGASFASLQASPMGRRVYERMGFTTPTEYRVLTQ
ncbi:MAG: GNAT family N-acetyltransferase [bacterium]